MVSNLKLSTYLNERKVKKTVSNNDKQLRNNYWIQFFNADKKSLEKALLQLSNIKVNELESFYIEDNFSYKINVDILNMKYLYFEQLKKKSYPERMVTEKLEREVSFYPFFKPFLSMTKGLLQCLKMIPDHVLDISIPQLLKSIYKISYKALVLELNIYRLSDQSVDGSSEEGYQYFQDTILRDHEYLKYFLEEYPVVLRLILFTIHEWVTFFKELDIHLEQDETQLNEIFNDTNKIGSLVNLSLGMGDLHNGKSVAILEFSSTVKLVYKPRSLMIDVKYNELVRFLNNKRSTKLKFYESKVLDKGSYGWTAFIKNEECKDRSQIENYYTRSGHLLALLYILNATDFHHENIIALNEYPLPIDLETLFHQKMLNTSEDNFNLSALNTAYNKINHSVKTSGLLPNQMFSNQEHTNALDVSGLGAKEQQQSPYKVETLINKETDKIKIDKAYFEIQTEKNIPTINGDSFSSLEYVEFIIFGFKELYDWIMINKNEFKKQLLNFGDVENRYLLRGSDQYARLLKQSLHPDFLRNGVDRDIFLHRLNLNRLETPYMTKILNNEKTDLLNLNIPYFTTIIGKKHLYLSENIKVQNFFEKSSLEQSLNTINKLSGKDKRFQINIIYMSILASEPVNNKTPIPMNYSKKITYVPTKAEYLKEASRIGDYILSQAIEGEINNNTDLCWISTIYYGPDEKNWKVKPTGVDLYNGNAGVAIFFSQLARATNSKYYKQIAYDSMNSIRQGLNTIGSDELTQRGAFDSWIGCIYSLHILSKTFNDNEIKQEVVKSLKRFDISMDTIKEFDVISGLAGYLGILLTIYEDTKVPFILGFAERCVELIINNTTLLADGMSWISPRDHRAYTGFAHGSAGIVTMLARANTIIKSPKIIRVIEKALKFERNNYNPTYRNWRSINSQEKYQFAWCHGAPGILLSRLMLKKCGYHDHLIDNEITIAIDTTLERCISYNHSLCHGNFGQIEILNLAKNIGIPYPGLSNKIDLIKEHVVKDIYNNSFTNLRSKRTEVQGIMNGLAGYGFGLLSLYFDNQIPSILTLEK